MSKNINVKDKVDKGAIHLRAIFEIFGKPKENVDDAIKLLVEKLKTMDQYKIILEKYFDAKEVENMWSNFVELEILAKDLNSVIDLVIDYLPSSIEIIEPENVTLNANDMAGVLNDLSVRIIEINQEYQKAIIQSNIMRDKLNQVVAYTIINYLTKGPMSLDSLSDNTKIEPSDLKEFLDRLVKLNKIDFADEKYQLKRG